TLARTKGTLTITKPVGKKHLNS
ncbi:Rad51 protein, partial [Danaus plexippus plexippus]